MTRLGNLNPPVIRTHKEDRALAEARGEPAGLLRAIGGAIENEWIAAMAGQQVARWTSDTGEPDELFPVTMTENTPYFEALTEGIPPQYWSKFASARNDNEASLIRHQLLRRVKNDRILSERGWTGAGLRLLANVFDPVEIAADAATAGAITGITKATKMSRLARAVSAGAIIGATEGTMEAYRTTQDPTRDAYDVAYAALGGFVAGTALTGLMLRGEAGQARRLATSAQDDIDLTALREAGFELSDKGRRRFFMGYAGEQDKVRREMAEFLELDDASRIDDVLAAAQQPGTTAIGRRDGGDLTDLIFDSIADASDEPGVGGVTGALRFGMVGTGVRSPLARVRKLFRMLSEDVLPDASGNPNILSATEAIAMQTGRHIDEVGATQLSTIRNWAKREGLRVNGRTAQRFNETVGRATRDGVDDILDPDVKKAAQELMEIRNRTLRRAQRHGVPGTADIVENPNYITTVWGARQIEEMIAKVGEEHTLALVSEAVLRNSPTLTPEQAGQLGKAIIHGTIRRHYLPDVKVAKLLDERHADELKNILRHEVGLDAAEVETILYDVLKDAKDPKKITRAYKRITVDYKHSLAVTDLDGNPLTISVEDLMENDAFSLTLSYCRQMEGAIAERKLLEGLTEAGKDTPVSFAGVLENIRQRDLPRIDAKHRPKLRRDIKRAELLHRVVMGQPLGTMDPTAAKWLRMVRKFNMARVGGKFGLAQIPEIGTLMGAGTIRGFMNSMPGFKALVKRAADGHLSDEFLRELQAMTGLGTDGLSLRLGRNVHRYESIGGIEQLDPSAKLERGVDRLVKAVSYGSGMTPINTFSQLAAASAAVQKFVRIVESGAVPSVRRLAMIGLTEADAHRIAAQIKKFSALEEGAFGLRMRKMNIDKWADQGAAAKLVIGVNKWANRVIQKNDPGQMMAWMTTDWARILLQFRTFNISSWDKQVVTSLYARDAQVFREWSGAMYFGALTWIGLQYANSIGRKDRNAYLAERMTIPQIARGAFQRAGWAAMMPGPVDTAASLFSRGPFFSYGRTSGLDANALFGNPTVDTAIKGWRTGTGILSTLTNPDYRYSETNWRNDMRLIPLGNMLGIQNGLQMFGDSMNLPRHSSRRR